MPAQRIAWVVPAGLASPLVTLGRMQIGAPLARLLGAEGLSGGSESLAVRLLLAAYLVGSSIVLPRNTPATSTHRLRRRDSPGHSRAAAFQHLVLRSTRSRSGLALRSTGGRSGLKTPRVWPMWNVGTYLVPLRRGESSCRAA